MGHRIDGGDQVALAARLILISQASVGGAGGVINITAHLEPFGIGYFHLILQGQSSQGDLVVA